MGMGEVKGGGAGEIETKDTVIIVLKRNRISKGAGKTEFQSSQVMIEDFGRKEWSKFGIQFSFLYNSGFESKRKGRKISSFQSKLLNGIGAIFSNIS